MFAKEDVYKLSYEVAEETINKESIGFIDTECNFVKHSLITILQHVYDNIDIFDKNRLNKLENLYNRFCLWMT